MSKRIALTRSTKILVRVAICGAFMVGLLAFGWWLGGILGWFAPFISMPVGYVAGGLSFWIGEDLMDLFPTKEKAPY